MQAYMVWRPVSFRCTSRLDDEGDFMTYDDTEHEGIEIRGVFLDRDAAELVRDQSDLRLGVTQFTLDEPISLGLDATFPKERGA